MLSAFLSDDRLITPSPTPAASHVEHFTLLQQQFRDRWKTVDVFEPDDHDILVVPSLTLDQRGLKNIKGANHYEERLLFSLIRLQNPGTRLIYVTSQPIHPSIIDYYLHLLPGIPFSHARSRLLLLSVYDSSYKSLTQKILERPRLIQRIKQALRPNCSFITCFNSTELERELAVTLDIPLLAVDPNLLYWGTKSGSRQIFAECGVPHPDGSDLVSTPAQLAEVTAQLWERQPDLKRIVIKLNEGFSGEGNALLDLRPIGDRAPASPATHAERVQAILKSFETMSFQAEKETWETFSSRIPDLGAIAEAFVEGEEKRSPSVQVSIMPNGSVEVLSTHDQILGGPDGQTFLGCRFPADDAYRFRIQEWGLKIGQNLAAKGALERLGIDFIAIHHPERTGTPEEWELQAIEINLRKGGTTHPFMTLKLLTNGSYNLADGLFYSRQGMPKYYVASDNVESAQYRGLMPDDLMDILARNRLNFQSTTETGTVFHLMGCLSEFGKLGLTSIGNSLEEAEAIYEQAIAVLDQETSLGSPLVSSPVPSYSFA
jgi:hypothetical protein